MPQWSLSPLGHLQSLRHLSVSLSGYHWSRELLRRDLGISWSELQRIDLENSTSLSSIEILGDCALYLPDLTSLSIPIDASILPEYPVPAGRSSEPIRLVLERYPISEESWPHIAAYIAATYPKAEVSTIMLLMDELESDSEGEQEWWYEVAKMVPIMATVGWTERSLIHEGVVSVESEL
ncbi:uncharacterized protein PHACADRAFT_249077 [Phanerochaete carnosa HHB-10118-sp]|uniref:Uncharacterized protein n=1 Tax=Phanerochaete carnosa (strain HHB-10118-sp) TaxID=650164 RepID=K5V842_PHACS|nr:uncharacterized protein PHACADRAFT_249077 [Phanerochaete carnosa HHB-10118-sp]EKM58946.1 hypothetical protein PHACADRAFT_249077 [Phanerochaete carnosa HHB-10118-sp]